MIHDTFGVYFDAPEDLIVIVVPFSSRLVKGFGRVVAMDRVSWYHRYCNMQETWHKRANDNIRNQLLLDRIEYQHVK